MQLKTGVKIQGVRPELLLALQICDGVYWRMFKTDIVVTSIVDGAHMQGSMHYLGRAADLRIWGLEASIEALVKSLKISLGENYDVVLEKDHIHLEYDPKELKTVKV